ncbi:TPA: slipin family protein [Candidatus Poribacteria bacterium]|nr:slipin family protein [Candidatus Poribacteria bacterium]
MEAIWLIPVIVVVLIILANSLRIVKEYERGVVLRFGKFHTVKNPGLRLIFPWIDRMTKMQLRVVTMDVPSQDIITKDNVSVKVNAVIFFRIIDPEKAFLEVEEYLKATFQMAQTTLRSVLGKVELDELLAEREKLNHELQTIIDSLTDPWGVKVTAVEIKDVELTEQLTRAMARVAEAERERRAKVIHAEGEKQASETLSEAARVLASEPYALQLRYLQTLVEISAEKNSTIIFPLPIDLIKPLTDLLSKKAEG